jgi:hypothetical protein
MWHKRRPLYLKTQSVPRCKHFISVIKTNQFMLYVAQAQTALFKGPVRTAL